MRRLLTLAIIVIIGVLAYNSFYGTEDEKDEVKGITKELKDVGKSIKDLLKSENEKLKAGKYDDIVDKLNALKETAKDLGKDFSDNLQKIEEKKQLLEEVERTTPDEYGTSKKDKEEELRREIDQLLEELSNDLESNN